MKDSPTKHQTAMPASSDATVGRTPSTSESSARQKKRDRFASAVIVVALVVVLAWLWSTAPVRKVDHTTSNKELMTSAALSGDPNSLSQKWRFSAARNSTLRPFMVSATVIIPEENGIVAVDPNDGSELWHYKRDRTLCAATTSDELVFASFQGPSGCSETVSLRPHTGEYFGTRRSTTSANVTSIRSNSYSGVFSADLLELWRNDLVRVVEYGRLQAPQEPDMQPHPECKIVDALTRLEFLAVLNDCGSEQRLVIQNAKPEESRKPEVYADVNLGPVNKNRQLVAVASGAVSLFDGHSITAYNKSGGVISSFSPPPQNGKILPEQRALPKQPLLSDLPHHMTWYSPWGLMGFDPTQLDFSFIFPEAVGTAVVVGERAAFPTESGIAIADWDSQKVIKVLPLEPTDAAVRTRKNKFEPTTLLVAGSSLVVVTDDSISGYRMS